MPPTLALLLCTGFVLFLLRLDRRQAQTVSLGLWLPTIWMLAIASKPLGRWIPYASEGAGAGSPLDRGFHILLLFLALCLLAKRGLDWSKVVAENVSVVMLLMYMLVSILWSDTVYVSLKRWIRELTAVLMALIPLTESMPREAVKTIIRRTVYILIPFSILLIKYFPEYGVAYGRWSGGQMWVGVTSQKNSLGRLCLVAVFFLIWTIMNRKSQRDISPIRYLTLVEILLLGLSLHLMRGPTLQAYSATGAAALIFGLCAFMGLVWLRKRQREPRTVTTTMIVAFLICLGTVTPLVGGASIKGVSTYFGRDETLTGRTEIWAGVVPFLNQHPLLGSGFGSFWTPEIEQAVQQGEAHSGYLEVLLHLGAIGILVTGAFLVSCGCVAGRSLKSDFYWASLGLCVLLMTLVHNITESSLNSLTSHLTATVLFLAVSTSYTATHGQVSDSIYLNVSKKIE